MNDKRKYTGRCTKPTSGDTTSATKAKINKACNAYYAKHSETIKAVKRALYKQLRSLAAGKTKIVIIEIR